MPIISGGQVMPGGLVTEGLGGSVRVLRADYSLAADGGAVGTINLLPAGTIPSGAIILGGWLEVTTALTSGGAATVSVEVEAAGDVIAAAAVGGAPWSTTGRKNTVPAFTGASSVATTAARTVTATVAVAALTAGAFRVYLVYAETA